MGFVPRGHLCVKHDARTSEPHTWCKETVQDVQQTAHCTNNSGNNLHKPFTNEGLGGIIGHYNQGCSGGQTHLNSVYPPL